MSREKSVQIPESLFVQIAKYFLLDEQDEQTKAFIKRGLERKLDAITNHNLYTQYKTAPTEQEQEQARLEYLDRIGVPSSFRY